MGCKLIAHAVGQVVGWEIHPATAQRDWMDAVPGKFVYRCLPMVMANQVGWILTCPITFSATWSGNPEPAAVKLRFPDGPESNLNFVAAHFGAGVVTFPMPWVFRTSPGYGLWVRGPTNTIKENATALEGIVETDWAPYSFTMNWRLNKRNTEVWFKKGEPVCMLVPFPLALPDEVEPEMKTLDDDPQLKADFYQFVARRTANLDRLGKTGTGHWDKGYTKGHMPGGAEVDEHRKAFKLREFK